MKKFERLFSFFQHDFEEIFTRFLVENKWIEKTEDLYSHRFLSRSIVPHVQTLLTLFNQTEVPEKNAPPVVRSEQFKKTYWESNNRRNRELAYLLAFFPTNVARLWSVFEELSALGFFFIEVSVFG